MNGDTADMMHNANLLCGRRFTLTTYNPFKKLKLGKTKIGDSSKRKHTKVSDIESETYIKNRICSETLNNILKSFSLDKRTKSHKSQSKDKRAKVDPSPKKSKKVKSPLSRKKIQTVLQSKPDSLQDSTLKASPKKAKFFPLTIAKPEVSLQESNIWKQLPNPEGMFQSGIKSPKIISKIQLERLGAFFKKKKLEDKAQGQQIERQVDPKKENLLLGPHKENSDLMHKGDHFHEKPRVLSSTCDANNSLVSGDEKSPILVRKGEIHHHDPHSRESTYRYLPPEDYLPNTKYTEVSYLENPSNIDIDSPSHSVINGFRFAFRDEEGLA